MTLKPGDEQAIDLCTRMCYNRVAPHPSCSQEGKVWSNRYEEGKDGGTTVFRDRRLVPTREEVRFELNLLTIIAAPGVNRCPARLATSRNTLPMTKRHNSQPGTTASSSRRAIFVLLILILPPMMGVSAFAHDGTAFIRRDESLYPLSRGELRRTDLTPPDWIADVSTMPSLVLPSPQGVVPAPTNKVAGSPLLTSLPRAYNGLSSGPDRRIRPRRSRRASILRCAQPSKPSSQHPVLRPSRSP